MRLILLENKAQKNLLARGVQISVEHVMAPSVHVHSLQPSAAMNSAPEKCVCPLYVQAEKDEKVGLLAPVSCVYSVFLTNQLLVVDEFVI